MNMVQTNEYGGYQPRHPFGDDRPDDLPLAAEIWDAAKVPSPVNSSPVVRALYEAVKQLELQSLEQ